MNIIYEALHVSPAVSEDLADINALMKQLSDDLSYNPEYVGITTVQHVLGGGCIQAARDTDAGVAPGRNGKIVAMATLLFCHTLHGLIAYTHDVVTDRDYLKRGIGTAVMNRLIATARFWGVKHIDLTSNASRTDAHKLYLKLGFEQRDTFVFRKKLR